MCSITVANGSALTEKGGEAGMKDNDLITRREVELVLLEKGQRSRRYRIGEFWELNFDEIREALSEYQPKIVRCRDCKHWDKTTRKEGNDCIFGPWEDAECDIFRDWDSYGELGEDFRRTNGDWFCADGERKE